MRRRLAPSTPFVLLLTWALHLALGVECASAKRVFAKDLLLLGPLPRSVLENDGSRLGPSLSVVPEIDPLRARPRVGDRVALAPGEGAVFRSVKAGSTTIPLPSEGVYWLSTRLQVSSWAEVTIDVETLANSGTSKPTTTTLYVDGHRVGEPNEDGTLERTLGLFRGWHQVLVRVDAVSQGSVGLSAVTYSGAKLRFVAEARRTFARFDRSRAVPSISATAVSPDGSWIARRQSVREIEGEGQIATTALLDASGHVRVHEIDGVPVAFSPDGRDLLLRRGSDLALWAVPAGPSRTVLRGEEGMSSIHFHPNGRSLLITSTKGASSPSRDSDAPYRQLDLREGVPDFTPRAHLHWIDLESGARRRLSGTGDFVLDDAVFDASGDRVIYAKTVPQAERPWFHTELRALDLRGGEDELLTKFSGGWEVRPQKMTVSRDGRWLAFIGPPEEVGGGRPEHNVYNYQLWLLNLTDGSFERLSGSWPLSFGASSGSSLVWGRDSETLYATVLAASHQRLVSVRKVDGAWKIDSLSHRGEVVSSVGYSHDRNVVCYVAGGRTQPGTLCRYDLRDNKETVLEAFGDRFLEEWAIVSPVDASFQGPSGDLIESWYYPPLQNFGDEKPPIVTYYYGGASPTASRFDTTHQMFAANGYAVLVINSRGAAGYGDAFADHHVGDWGPLSSSDILAGVQNFTQEHPEFDGDKVGIYGGSYGGFMTKYLIGETDRFAAAVSLYGISDLASYWGQGAWGWTYGDMSVGGARPWTDPSLFVEHSPVFRADRMNTPLLLMHGLADSNVTPGESAQMFTAMRIQGKTVEYVRFPGEDHGISGTFENRAAHRTMILDWFDRHLRGQGEAWEARW